MRRRLYIWIPICVIALLVVPFARSLWFYRGLPLARDVPYPDLKGVSIATPPPGEFVDEPVAGHGQVVVDWSHNNLLSPAELNALTTRLMARGMSILDTTSSDDLAQALRSAAALVVINPGEPFSVREIDAVRRFVEKGGHLLLVADPTRYTLVETAYDYEFFLSARLLNPLAQAFGLTYEEDFLYNVVKNEGNYQNIILQRFQETPLTAGLSEVAFYSTHSIHSSDGGVILTDGETRSSTDELNHDLAVAALAGADRVLALGDLTFMTGGYAGVLDNGRLISNITDFLAGAERRYDVLDFPHYFSQEVVVIPVAASELGTKQIIAISDLQQALKTVEKRLIVQKEEDPDRDALFIGLFDDTTAVTGYLEESGISVEIEEEDGEVVSRTLDISDMGAVDAAGMALLTLQQQGERRVLVILSDEAGNLQSILDNLLSGKLAGCLAVNDALALCAVGEGGGDWGNGADGDEEPEDGQVVVGGGSILIVSETDLSWEVDCYDGSFFYDLTLYETYDVTTWSEYEEGNPTLADLQAYDLVIWAIGNCSGKAPSDEDAETLQQFVAEGGRLLIDGMNVGQDWNGTPFYDQVCHAEASGTAPQVDLEVADGDHPLARGYDEGQVLSFVEGIEDFEPDVLSAKSDARAVFLRGPQSQEAGAPSIIAYEGGGARIVYIGFPIYLLEQDAMDTMILNAVAWLLGE